MQNQEKARKLNWVQPALLLLAAAGGYATANFDTWRGDAPPDPARIEQCISRLAQYAYGLPKERQMQLGRVAHFYNRELDLCLYRGNYVDSTEEGYYVEKEIVDVFSNRVLARYEYIDGWPLTEEADAFDAEYDRLFQTAP